MKFTFFCDCIRVCGPMLCTAGCITGVYGFINSQFIQSQIQIVVQVKDLIITDFLQANMAVHP